MSVLSLKCLLILILMFFAESPAAQNTSSSLSTEETLSSHGSITGSFISETNTWYVSKDGSDDNDCQTAAAPCQNLQTVLDRATDGADIYVTSFDLPLYSNYECNLETHISFTLSSLNESGTEMHCKSGVTSEYQQSKRFTAVQSNIAMVGIDLYTSVEIHVSDCIFEKEQIIGGGLGIGHFRVRVKDDPVQNTPLREIASHIHIDSSYFTLIDLELHHGDSIGSVNLTNTTFLNSSITTHLCHCGFLLKDSVIFNTGMVVGAAFVILQNCVVEMVSKQQENAEGCALTATGHLAKVDRKDWRSFYCPWNHCDFEHPTLVITNSQFIGSIRNVHKSVIHCDGMDLKLYNTTFNMTEVNMLRQYIYSQGSVSGSNVTFDASDMFHPTSLVNTTAISLNTVHVICPRFLHVQHMSRNKTILYSCNYCEKDTYSPGKLSVQELSMSKHGLVDQTTEPRCLPCPVGANCDKQGITGLPNYWGFRDQANFVKMLRCPDGYCCMDNETCEEIYSCNTGRAGILCGNCGNNYTEALLSTDCVLSEGCSQGLVLTLYIMCSVSYALALLAVKSLKDSLLKVLKNLCKTIKTQALARLQNCRINCLNNTMQSSGTVKIELRSSHETEIESVSNADIKTNCHETKVQGLRSATDDLNQRSKLDDTSNQVIELEPTTDFCEDQRFTKSNVDNEVSYKKDDGIKYIQILLYYVQDASLFRVKLPSIGQQSETFIFKILKFSPEIISDIYGHISEMCFSGAGAVGKVMFKSFFGPSVMLMLLFIYLIQKLLSKFFFTQSCIWIKIRASMLQAFLLTVLFSYQQVIKGVLSLVQCVEVGKTQVLYLQGDIKCYTYWQVLVQIYIYLNIFPVFFLVSIASFLVNEKSMSVRTFICVSLFPVPTMVYHYTSNYWQQNHCGIMVKPHEDQDIENKTDLEISKDAALSTDECTSKLRLETVEVEHKKMTKHSSKHSVELEHNQSEEVIVHTLLDQYRTLSICRIRFTWLCVHKMYRVLLVVCKTYITEPVLKLLIMSALLVTVLVGNTIIKPYKDRRANMTAMLSYVANLCIAMLNLWKTGLVTFGCEINCSFKESLLRYFEIIEKFLLIYVPVIALLGWLFHTAVQKCLKSKKE